MVIDIELFLSFKGNKSYSISEDDYYNLLKTGFIPERIKADIFNYVIETGIEKNKYRIRTEEA